MTRFRDLGGEKNSFGSLAFDVQVRLNTNRAVAVFWAAGGSGCSGAD